MEAGSGIRVNATAREPSRLARLGIGSGRFYATGAGLSSTVRGASVTVDSPTADGLSRAIAAAERDASRAAGFWEMRGNGH